MFCKVREDGRVVTRALRNIFSVNTDGINELLGIDMADNEGSKFWMQVMNDLQRSKLQDILIACTDNLKVFTDAIEILLPKKQI